MSSELVKRPSTALEFTDEQRKLILNSFLNGATESEAAVLLELAKLRGLNPITRQIHFVKRWDSEKKGLVWAAQVGIDGLRAIAERTGLYGGQDEPEFEYDGKTLRCCKVRVYRKGWERPAVGVAHYSEYVQFKKDGGPNHMWGTKPHVMLAKCAEALALRKAFPEDTSGLYAPEELEEDSDERDVTPEDAQPKPALPSGAVALRETMKARATEILGFKEDPAKQSMSGSQVWTAIMEVARERGLSEKVAGAKLKEIVGKSKLGDLVDADFNKFRRWLEDAPSGDDDVPPHDDSHAPSDVPF